MVTKEEALQIRVDMYMIERMQANEIADFVEMKAMDLLHIDSDNVEIEKEKSDLFDNICDHYHLLVTKRPQRK